MLITPSFINLKWTINGDCRLVIETGMSSKEICKIYLLLNVTKQDLRDMYDIKLDIVKISEKRKLFIKVLIDDDVTL